MGEGQKLTRLQHEPSGYYFDFRHGVIVDGSCGIFCDPPRQPRSRHNLAQALEYFESWASTQVAVDAHAFGVDNGRLAEAERATASTA
jgi:hypothetical protein